MDFSITAINCNQIQIVFNILITNNDIFLDEYYDDDDYSHSVEDDYISPSDGKQTYLYS